MNSVSHPPFVPSSWEDCQPAIDAMFGNGGTQILQAIATSLLQSKSVVNPTASSYDSFSDDYNSLLQWCTCPIDTVTVKTQSISQELVRQRLLVGRHRYPLHQNIRETLPLLIQPRGGPCALLATIQSSMFLLISLMDIPHRLDMIKHGLLPISTIQPSPTTPSIIHQSSVIADDTPSNHVTTEELLAQALTDILLRCTTELKPSTESLSVKIIIPIGCKETSLLKFYIATIPISEGRGGDQVYACVLKALGFWGCHSNDENHASSLSQSLTQSLSETLNLPFNASLRGLGALCIVLSAVLSRSVSFLHSDMDGVTPLIGRFGHCNIELTTLLLTGRACSGLFDTIDGWKTFDEMQQNSTVDKNNDSNEVSNGFRMSGVHCQSNIGYLSHTEALRYIEVGNYLKSPRFPVWLIQGENHYSVLWLLGSAATEPIQSTPKSTTVGPVTSSLGDQQFQILLRTCFNCFDSHGNGFINATSLPSVLDRLGTLLMEAYCLPRSLLWIDESNTGDNASVSSISTSSPLQSTTNTSFGILSSSDNNNNNSNNNNNYNNNNNNNNSNSSINSDTSNNNNSSIPSHTLSAYTQSMDPDGYGIITFEAFHNKVCLVLGILYDGLAEGTITEGISNSGLTEGLTETLSMTCYTFLHYNGYMSGASSTSVPSVEGALTEDSTVNNSISYGSPSFTIVGTDEPMYHPSSTIHHPSSTWLSSTVLSLPLALVLRTRWNLNDCYYIGKIPKID